MIMGRLELSLATDFYEFLWKAAVRLRLQSSLLAFG